MVTPSRGFPLRIGRLMLLIAALATGLGGVASYVRMSHSDIQYNNHRTQWLIEIEECFLGGSLTILGAAVLVEFLYRKEAARTASMGRWTIGVAFIFMVLRLGEYLGHDAAMSFRHTGRISAERFFALVANPGEWGFGVIRSLPLALGGMWLMFLASSCPETNRVDSIEWIGRVVGGVIFLSWFAGFVLA